MEDNETAASTKDVLVAYNEDAEALFGALSRILAPVRPQQDGGDQHVRCAAVMAAYLKDADYEPGDEIWNLEGMIITASKAANVDAETLARLAVEAATSAGLKVQRSASEDAVWQAREACAERDWACPVEERDSAVEAHADDPERLPAALNPFDFDELPGLLGDVARWSHGFAFKPVPEFAVASALAVLSVLFGRRYATPTGLGLNLYIVGIAPTGGGKEAALSAPHALLDEAGFSFLLGPGDFTSDSAIEASLRFRPCQAMFLDEFGQLLGAVQGRNAPSFAKLARKALLELFSKSGPGGRWTGKARAGDEINKAAAPIYSPTLSLLGCSTVEGFFEGLTLDNLADGFVNRLLVVRAKAVGARNMDATRTTIPVALVQAVRDAYESSKVGDGNIPRTAGDKAALKVVPWADAAAETAWLAVAEWEDTERDNGPSRDGIVGRASEQTLKLATLAALARAPGAPVVHAGDVHWGLALVRASIATLDDGISQNMAGSEFESLVKAIERALRSSKTGTLPMSLLLRARGVSKADDRMVAAAIGRLVATGRARQEISAPDGGGRPRNSVSLLPDR